MLFHWDEMTKVKPIIASLTGTELTSGSSILLLTGVIYERMRCEQEGGEEPNGRRGFL